MLKKLLFLCLSLGSFFLSNINVLDKRSKSKRFSGRKFTKASEKSAFFLIIIFLLCNSAAIYPIVIRHDKNDADYKKLGERYRNAYVNLRGATGTLIAPRWVLTAAHAVAELVPGNSRYNAAASPAKAEIGGRNYLVDKVILHPNWNQPRRANDIALLRLAEPVGEIAPVQIYRGKDEVGKIVTFVGRGYSGNGKEGITSKEMLLRAAENRVEKADEKWISFVFDAPDSPNVLPLEGISGPGDSGGPAIIEDKGVLYTVGISSHQFTVGGVEGIYGALENYTRVSSYTNWIDKTIKAETDVKTAVANHSESLKNLDSYIEKLMNDWKIPGLSIAVVKDDKLIYSKGYGVREIGKTEPVDERTLFPVGSITKSFTAASAALLVDEKKMTWDDAVTKHLPDFQLYSAALTDQVTIRDLLAHRTGLPRANGSLLSPYNRGETVRRMRYLKPIAGLRAQFTYNNQMYLAAGLAIEKASQTNWDEFVKQRLFTPLKMTASNLSINELKKQKNAAVPHAVMQDKVQILPYDDKDSIAPAGAVNSNAVDLSNWVRMFLDNGKFEEKQILSPTAVRIMHGQQTVIPVGILSQKLFPSTHLQGYGMGWFLRDYRGCKAVEHGGNVGGMTAQIGMLPEENLGVVILSNMDSTPAPQILMYRIFDRFLGDADKQIDLSAEYKKLSDEGSAQTLAQEKDLSAKRQAYAKTSLPLEGFAGIYANELYGTAQISERGGKLFLKFNDDAQGELEHWEKDTFRIVWTNPFYLEAVGKTFVAFQIENGKITELKAQNLADYKRLPAANNQ